MFRKLLTVSAGAAVAVAAIAALWASNAVAAVATTSAPVFDPNNFVAVIDNPYFPCRSVGRSCTAVSRTARRSVTS